VLSNEKQFNRDLYGGLMHSFIMWGFLTLFIATLIIMVDQYAFQKVLHMTFWEGDFYLAYSFIVDAMGLLFVVGIGMAMYRRYWVRNHRLWGRHTSTEDDIFIWTLFALGIGGFLLEGLRIYSAGIPDHEIVSFVGYGLALGFNGIGLATLGSRAGRAQWFGAERREPPLARVVDPLADRLLLHRVGSLRQAVPHALLLRERRHARREGGSAPSERPSDLDATNAESIDDFTWKEILDQDACTKCGRCSSVCPAKASDRPLDPRNVILDLKSYREDLDAGGEEQPIVADGGTSVINAETMESCMACMACMDACPVEIEHLKSFTRLNRQMTDQGDVAPSMQDVFQNVMQNGNTFGDSPRNRGDWADELEFDVTDAREEKEDSTSGTSATSRATTSATSRSPARSRPSSRKRTSASASSSTTRSSTATTSAASAKSCSTSNLPATTSRPGRTVSSTKSSVRTPTPTTRSKTSIRRSTSTSSRTIR